MKQTALVVLFAFFVLLSSSLDAQWSDNPGINTAVTTAFNEQNSQISASDGAGGIIIAWRDFRNGTSQDIYAQRINAAGVVQWTNDVAICTALGNQYSPIIVSDGAGGAIITWYDVREGANSDIYAQRVNGAGVVQWTANGVAISVAVNNQFSPTILSDGSGGAIITWYDLRSGTNYDIYAQRVDAAGTVQWAVDGVAISAAGGNQQRPIIVSDGAGGAIISWFDARSLTNDDIYAQRVNAAGVVQWTTDGVVISAASNNQQYPALVADGAGGAVITWQDFRNGTNDDIYAQRINAAGAVQWKADGVIISATVDEQYAPAIAGDGAGGAIITWNDFRGGTDYDVYAQRISGAGTIQWTFNGIPIAATSNNQANPQIVNDGAGGAIIAWEDARSNPYKDIYGQRINAAGESQWAYGGMGISVSSTGKQIPAIVGDGAGGAIISWVDMRSSFDVYAQKVMANSLLGDGSVKIQSVKDVKYDQGGRVNIFWNASRYDAYGDYNPISSYSIFRGMRPSSTGMSAIAFSSNQYLAMKKEGTLASNYYLKGFSTEGVTDTIYWQWIDDVTARRLDKYVYAAPTLADSTPQGLQRQYFMVTSNLYDRSWLSAPDSGYSVDNLPPGPVAQPVAQPQTGPSVFVHWHPDYADPDVGSYEVYRSTQGGFTPSLSTLIGQSRDTSFVDNAPVSGSFNYYRILTVDVHGNRSLPSIQAAAGIAQTSQYSISDKWNMVSVPLTVSDYTKTALYPNAISKAYAYGTGGYVIQTTLTNGGGYWVKFSSAQSVSMTGFQRTTDTVNVGVGWNMVGSLSSSFPVANIVSIPGGIFTTKFYDYVGSSYVIASDIVPGRGYWVKVKQAGKLILSTTGNTPSADRIKIEDTDEQPPMSPDDVMSALPTSFSLEQNYPNPFNPTTTISYALAATEHVKLSVYDMLGQEMATLVNETQEAGYKSVSFDASGLPSGMYVYRISAGSFNAQKKLLLVK